MQVCFNNLIMDSRRAVFAAEQDTLIISDLFLGNGAMRRRKPDIMLTSQHHDLWERLLGLLSEYRPKTIALLGDIKPSQGNLDDDEADELRSLFRKLRAKGRDVVQVASHSERLSGPTMKAIGIEPQENHFIDPFTLIHRRKIFVYPRYEASLSGFWINGGVHPLCAVPTPGPASEEGWLRYPAFLFTGFALVMPPFVTYAQGWEVMQTERLPKQARAWTVLGDQMKELDLHALPPPPETIRQIIRPTAKQKGRQGHEDAGEGE